MIYIFIFINITYINQGSIIWINCKCDFPSKKKKKKVQMSFIPSEEIKNRQWKCDLQTKKKGGVDFRLK